jgi:N-acetylornithine carbamoyltransferase
MPTGTPVPEVSPIQGRDVVTLGTFSPEEIRWVLARARRLKADGFGQPLQGRSLAMVFFNPSLRTRASFAVAFSTLGGTVIDLVAGRDLWPLEIREGAVMAGAADEHVRDAARALSEYVDAIAIRALARGQDWAQERRDLVIVSFQKHSRVPIFNMESVLDHPCQAFGDALTVEEAFGETRGRKLALVWCYHPQARPLAVPHGVVTMAAKMGMRLTVAHPEEFGLDPDLMREAGQAAEATGGRVRVVSDAREAVEGAEVVYAAPWGSIRFHSRPEEEAEARLRHRDRRVTTELLAAAPGARFMHAMPIRRNVEADDAVVDAPSSLVIPQAANRLHVQRALFLSVLGA